MTIELLPVAMAGLIGGVVMVVIESAAVTRTVSRDCQILNRASGLEGFVPEPLNLDLPGRARVGWSKVKDRSWYEREAWRFDRR